MMMVVVDEVVGLVVVRLGPALGKYPSNQPAGDLLRFAPQTQPLPEWDIYDHGIHFFFAFSFLDWMVVLLVMGTMIICTIVINTSLRTLPRLLYLESRMISVDNLLQPKSSLEIIIKCWNCKFAPCGGENFFCFTLPWKERHDHEERI